MSNRKKQNSQAERWVELGEQLTQLVPHLMGVLTDEDEFVDIKIKVMPDRTVLAVLRAFAPDGSMIVCFGSGYGFTGALLAIDGTVNSGRWRPDKPWSDRPQLKGKSD